VTTWAPTTDRVIDKGFGDDREGRAIQGAILHHGAGPSVLGYVANWNSRNSHPNYHVAQNGDVSGIVHPTRQAFSTAHDVDNISITFEIDNSTGAPNWEITDDSFEAIIQVLLHHYKESGRKGFAKNIRGVNQTEFFIGWHAQYKATACPGPYILSKIDWLVAELNRRVAQVPKPQPPVAPKPTPKPADISALADAVLRGEYGNGPERKRRLGSLYSAVQAEVNRRLAGGVAPKPSTGPNISALADAVLRGEYGNGPERKRRLGANYAAVQAEVNRRLGL
jgi:CW_7 repeat/N-acetylmuramoyl-L-alanine amidase